LGNFISVYTDEPRISAAPRSSDPAAIAQILAAHPDDDMASSLTQLVNGRFECEESDEAGRVLYAFQKVLETFSPSKTTVEIYLDEDQFPEMWRFAFEANNPPVALPTSSYGNPSVAYWPHGDVKTFLSTFRSLDFARLEKATRHPGAYRDEVREILEVLQFADLHASGVYVFINE